MLKSPDFPWVYRGGIDWFLHPGGTCDIAKLALPQARNSELTEDLVVGYSLACEDQPLERGEVRVPVAELLSGNKT